LRGVRDAMEKIVGVEVEAADGKIFETPISRLVSLQAKIISENPAITRVLYTVTDTAEKRPYVITIRAVQTKDFLTALVSEIPWEAPGKDR